MSRSYRMRAALPDLRTLGWVLAFGLVGACGSDAKPHDAGQNQDDGGGGADSGNEPGGDGGKDATVDAGKDAATDAGKDAAVDGSVDAGVGDPAMPGNDVPTLSKVGYFNDELGPRILLEGRDPNGDVAHYTIKFFKASMPVTFDLDSDDATPEVSSFTDALTSATGQAGFFKRFEPSAELLDKVDEVKITVDDAMGRISAELSARLGQAPAKGMGIECSPLGFDRCPMTSVCGVSNGRNVCVGLSMARVAACNAPLVLSPPAVTSVRGEVRQPSLWDAPLGCATNDPKSQADTIVKLHLSAAAARVVLSTDNANTQFDTMLYRLPMGCASAPPACVDETCACAQDVSGSNAKSVLTLMNLAAGDYWFVVDSFPSLDATGSGFELTVSLP